MKIYSSIRSLTKDIDRMKKSHKRIGFVPTMGFLHDGHLSLIRRAKKDTDCVVVSIFVNPAQFGPGEDFKKYPRDFKRDFAYCRKEGVDIVFAPRRESMYPQGYSAYVNLGRLTDKLCGASRPGHFRGVATIVTKLFNIVRPDIAYFGQKDAQQVVAIERVAQDLNMNMKIKVMPIVREKNGLAMSSRNVYLNAEERQKSLCLYKSLRLAKDLFNKGERSSRRIIEKMLGLIAGEGRVKIDYISIVDPEDLENIDTISKKALVLVAAWVGRTRLIDNIRLGG